MATEIVFGLIDVTAKKDSTLSTADQRPFAKLSAMRRDGNAAPKVATGEEFQWLLDGSYEPFPHQPLTAGAWGWFSESQSDGEGVFAAPPTLSVTFTRPHSSAGITLHLADPCPYTVKVSWSSLAGESLDEKTFVVEDGELNPFLENPVYNYGKIVMAFLESGHPHRYVRVTGIDYGLLHTFQGAELTEAILFEETDPTMVTLPDNTLEIKVLSSDVNFSILEPKGVYTMLAENQPMRVMRDGTYLGTFYLGEWEVGDMWMEEGEPENWTGATFRCVSAIGVLDQVQVLGGVYAGIPMETVITEIMGETAVDYILDDALKAVPITGWLPICTAREALQQVVFAAGARVDASRGHFLRIVSIDAPRARRQIGRERKLAGGVIRLAPFVSGVEVVGHTYTQVTTDTAVTLFTGKPGEGDHQIEFGAPSYAYAVTNCTLVKSAPNYAVIRVTAAQAALEQKITGKGYREGTLSAAVGDLKTRVDNVVTVRDATLVSPADAPGIARRLYEYYQRRHISECGFLLGEEQCGDLAEIFAARKYTAGGIQTQTILGNVLQMETNLTEEVVERAVIRGGV